MSRISTVSFLRTLAKNAGDLTTPRGQALHRAAGHVVRMDEELQRCRALAEEGADAAARIEAAASGIWETIRQQTLSADGSPTMVEWAHVPAGDPTRETILSYARAALGSPVYERPVDA